MKMDINWSNVLQTLFICAMVVFIIFGFKGCVEHMETERTNRANNMNPFERCVNACPVGWPTDRECLNECYVLINEEIK